MSRPPRRRAHLLLACALTLAGCGGPKPEPGRAVFWLAGRPQPAFDPDGPPDALRIALERQLSRGLVEFDTAGRVIPALADSIGCSRDSLSWTFRLRADARFTDGTRVSSADVRDALVAGLGRSDHATREWLLAAVKGVALVRAGRSLPPLGVETAGERRLVLRLAVPDRLLLEKLAVPGTATPWRRRSGSWRDAVGVGPYRVAAADSERSLTLVAVGTGAPGAHAKVDTLRVRFLAGSTRVRNILRRSGADLLWPLPPGFLEPGLPAGWEVGGAPASPERRLLLVLRPDVPPLNKLEVRDALARALNREELLAALDGLGEPLRRWLPGARQPFDWPQLESPMERAARQANEPRVREPRTRSLAPPKPESYHVVLAFDADQAGAALARALQGQWAAAGHYAELRGRHGADAATQPLKAAGAHATLVESEAPFSGLVPELTLLVSPLRGPARGAYRTGWRTRAYDRWLLPPGGTTRLDSDDVQREIAAARIVLPIASLPWRWAFRTGSPRPAVHPAFGIDWTEPSTGVQSARTR